MGTALNKILKDIIVKFHQMDGKDSIYVPGGIVMVFQLSGKLKNNIKKIKKIKMKYRLLSLEKNADPLLKNG